jgi:hypothetical protein
VKIGTSTWSEVAAGSDDAAAGGGLVKSRQESGQGFRRVAGSRDRHPVSGCAQKPGGDERGPRKPFGGLAESPRDGDRQPRAAYFYGIGVLFCMTTSLAEGGTGLGTCGFNEHTARLLCAAAGFGTVRPVETDNPFNIRYEISA